MYYFLSWKKPTFFAIWKYSRLSVIHLICCTILLCLKINYVVVNTEWLFVNGTTSFT